jgi:hypothetical protein
MFLLGREFIVWWSAMMADRDGIYIPVSLSIRVSIVFCAIIQFIYSLS